MCERDPQTYAIIGAAMEVHRVLRSGLAEPLYQDALEVELADRAIPHVREALLRVVYKGRTLASSYRADFFCFDRVLVELKALSRLTPREDAQVINYLSITRLPVALLINFGAEQLQWQRYAGLNQKGQSTD